MIEIQLETTLREQGRTFYWLAKETGISHTTLWRLKKGKALGINFDTLEKICRVLACQPGEVLSITPNKESKKNHRKPKGSRRLAYRSSRSPRAAKD